MNNEVINGNRIYLRPITAEDTEMVLKWRNSDRTVRNFYYRKPVTEEDHAKWLSEKVDKGDVRQYVVILKETDTPIGSVYLQHIESDTLTGETGVFFSEDAPAGQGLATEAVKLLGDEVGFNKLGLLHLTAKVISSNAASMKLHEKAGYRIVKEIKGETCTDGEIVNSTYFIRDVQVYKCDRDPLIKAETGKIKRLDDGSLEICVPGSKSITNRALLIAMLAEGESLLKGVLFSDDTESFLSCMESLGIEFEADRKNCTVRVKGCGGRIPDTNASLNVGSAGTAARFLTAVLGLTDGGEYRLDSSDQMKKRPMAPLLDSLKELGCEVIYEGEEGFFPFTLKPHGFSKNEVTVDIEKSSQFLSALLIAGPLTKTELNIGIVGTHGLRYVEITRNIMKSFGIETEKNSDAGLSYLVKHGTYKAAGYDIEPDASAAAYFYAMSQIMNIPVVIKGLDDSSMQGDIRFPEILRETLNSDGPITVDMGSLSDQALTLATSVLGRKAPTTITGISHIRHQECDRINAIVSNLAKAGIKVTESGDDITIEPGIPGPADIDSFGDHRVAMAFSLLGLSQPGINILDPCCCSKTFPDYFAYFDEIRLLTKSQSC
ncbi:MAG: 3-phosphoshikimate 1-carboxyvinyltransferase [Lachnospiraceae bacterium]|nr:3-phosphoshikimate 1-carboxyvinyltransferase [Lachnospiraceae bacterium]